MFAKSWFTKGFAELLAGQVARWTRIGLLPRPERQTIAVVGGGALPQSQVKLHVETGADVVCIERDQECAEVCRAVIKRLGLPRLTVVEADGRLCDYDSYDIVVVATLVQQKHLIAERIARTSRSAVFAPRVPVGLHQLWRESLNFELVSREGWKQIDAYTPRGSTIRALLFRRRGQRRNG